MPLIEEVEGRRGLGVLLEAAPNQLGVGRVVQTLQGVVSQAVGGPASDDQGLQGARTSQTRARGRSGKGI